MASENREVTENEKLRSETVSDSHFLPRESG